MQKYQRRYRFEQEIKGALEEKCDGVSASRDLKERIDMEILKKEKEAEDMKHINLKKTLIGVAAACLLIGGTAFAAGHVTSLSSHVFLGDMMHSYGDMPKAEKKLGYAVDSVEKFSNGYSFKNMHVSDVEGKDDTWNTLYTFKEMMINYDKKGEPSMWLDISKPVEAQVRKKAPDATRTCGNITLYYDEYTYKFVPPSYEMTEEDKRNEETGSYYISVGSSEIEIRKSTGVTWEKDGAHYNLSGFDLSLSADEMFDMAQEIIGAE